MLLPTKCVLLAEDNPHVAELMRRVVAGEEHATELVHVEDGDEVLDYLHARGRFAAHAPWPCVLFLDVGMPRVSGIEVLRQLKQDARLHVLPVVMMTSSEDQNQMATCYGLGANAYVVKPVLFPDFAATLRKLWGFWATLNQAPAPPLRTAAPPDPVVAPGSAPPAGRMAPAACRSVPGRPVARESV